MHVHSIAAQVHGRYLVDRPEGDRPFPVLVGFHEKRSAFVADMSECKILPPHVEAMLVPLRELIGALSIFDQVPQIEVAVGEEVTAMVLRIMAPLTHFIRVTLHERMTALRAVLLARSHRPKAFGFRRLLTHFA